MTFIFVLNMCDVSHHVLFSWKFEKIEGLAFFSGAQFPYLLINQIEELVLPGLLSYIDNWECEPQR
jgi:hypothetical protein